MTFTKEQWERFLSEVLQGNYSIACVVLLKPAGLNPLNYIPYRTYNRLAKKMKTNENEDNNNNNKKPVYSNKINAKNKITPQNNRPKTV